MTQNKLANVGNWFKNFGIKFWKGLVVSIKRFPYFFYCLVHPFDGFYDLKNDPKRRNIGGAVILYILLAVSAVMDGDGKLSDIFQATAVGTLPITICNFLLIPLSNFLNLDSAGTYYTISTIGMVLAYIIIFLGMITTHQYEFGKGIATAILSILGILIILFIMIFVG